VAIIDADGLFKGDRIARLSDSAKYAWPFLFLASNSCARIELNYQRIASSVFGRFQVPPSEKQFWTWINEYRAAFLLFVYQVGGSIWGQWTTSEKFLPKYKSKTDLATPAPDGPTFTAWKDRYMREKEAENAKFLSAQHFPKISESSERFPLGVGVGIGEGVGEGKRNPCALPKSGHARVSSFPDVHNPPFDTVEPIWNLKEKQRAFHEGFWPIYPRKRSKQDAEKAFCKAATSPELAQIIIEGVRVQLPALTADLKFCPFPSTWIRGKRWDDETADLAQPKLNPAMAAVMEADHQMRARKIC
jgi:hypothetical protein